MQRRAWVTRGLPLVAVVVAALSTPGLAAAASPPPRAVELVGLPDADGHPVTAALSSDDGDRVAYAIAGGTSGSPNGNASLLLAQRTPAGWESRQLVPPRTVLPDASVTAAAAAPDLGRFVVATAPSPFSGPVSLRGLNAGGQLDGYSVALPQLDRPPVLASSDDLRHLVAAPGRPLAPDDPSPSGGLYDFGTGLPRLIGLLPDGSAPRCGVDFARMGFGTPALASQHWVSADGERIAFLSRGSGDCFANPLRLYLRDGDTTIALSAPPAGETERDATFLQATPDGSQVFFATASRLVAQDGNDGIDVYRYMAGAGTACLTCAVGAANVSLNASGAPSVAVAQDGSRLFFTSTEQLVAGAGESGAENLYRFDVASGSLSYVSPSSGISADPRQGGALTPDGAVLVFASAAQVASIDTGDSRQYYRYDTRSDEIACVSCPLSGAAVGGALSGVETALVADGPLDLDGSSPLSADGSAFAFRSLDPLVAADQNHDDDVYEWRDGVLRLITDGSTASQNRIVGMSTDGRDLLFTSDAGLTAGLRPAAPRLYLARIGGGFPAQPPRLPCAGESCKPPPTEAPASPSISTSEVLGARNATERPQGWEQRRRLAARWQGRRLLVRVPGPGRLVVAGDLVKRSARHVGRAGWIRRRLTLTPRARALVARPSRRVVAVRVTFMPRHGQRSSLRVTTKLERWRTGR